MKDLVVRAGRGLRWYLRQATGESKWDDYVEQCARAGAAPVSRRTFERQRAQHNEHASRSRCC
jgi:hypothetical protein